MPLRTHKLKFIRKGESVLKENNIQLSTELLDEIVKEAYKQGVQDAQEKKDRQKEGYKKKVELGKHLKDNYGSFYFDFYNKIEKILEPQLLVRTLYLCSYLNFNNDLMINRKHMTEKDLSKIWKISEKQATRDKNKLIDNNILIINSDESLSINKLYFRKGDIMRDEAVESVRIFDNAIRELYEKCTPREHKKLALLYKLIPYVNNNWNIVCKNIHEENKDLIEPYELKDLVKILGVSNVTKLRNDLLKLTVGGEPVVMIQLVLNKSRILINPKIYYKGTRLNEVKCIEDDIRQILNKYKN